MGGKYLKAIITDQDPAMKAAIAMTFPNIVHRNCQWHILTKARDHLGLLYGSISGFKDELRAVIDYSWTVPDFEKNWKDMVKYYKLEDNSHLNLMFDNCDEWIPAYFHETFMADMSTLQRNESMNAAMKIWMTCNTSLYGFVVHFDKLLEGIYEKESDEDIRTMNETAIMCSCDPIETIARKVYTLNVFSIFKEKVRKSTGYRVREVEKDLKYEVCPAVPQIRTFVPTLIAVMRHIEMEPFLPAHYVLKRWMKGANSGVKRPTSMEVKEIDDLESVMLAGLTQDMQRVAIKAVKHRAAYDLTCKRIRELDAEVTKIIESMGIDLVEPTQNTTTTTEPSCVARKSLQYHDPPVSQCKGKRKPHRFKQPLEIKDVKKMQTCGYCHKKEGHNMKTCPKRFANEKIKRSQIYEIEDDDSEDYVSD